MMRLLPKTNIDFLKYLPKDLIWGLILPAVQWYR